MSDRLPEMRRSREDEDWRAFAGCQAWCSRDGILEINPFKPLAHFASFPEKRRPVGPLLTIVGAKAHLVLVSPNMQMITGFPKKNVRILTERPRD